MNKLLITTLVLLLGATASFGAGLEYKGDGQQVKVTNTAGTSSYSLTPTGVNLNGTIVSDTAYNALVQSAANTASALNTVEISLAPGGTTDLRMGSVENELDQINSVKLPAKMALVSVTTAENVLKVNAQGQAVDAGFAASNVLLGDGTRSMTGDLNMASAHKVINLQNGTNPTDAINKSQLDAAIAGLDWQPEVAEVKNTSVGLVGPVVPGYRVLVLGIAAGDFAAHTNEIATRNLADDGWDFVLPTAHWALFDAKDNNGYVYSADSGTWVQFSGADNFTPGDALGKIGNVLNVKYDDTTIGLNGSNQVYVKAGSIGNTQIASGAAIEESKLALAYQTGTLATMITDHSGDATIHRSINDSAASSTGLWSSFKVNSELSGKAASVHGHAISDVSGLETALSGKAASSHSHATSDITSFDSTVRGLLSVEGNGVDYNNSTGVFTLNTTEVQALFSASGNGIDYSGGAFSLDITEIDHNGLLNYAADQHTPLDDASATTSNLWSASKISSEIALVSPSNKLTIGGDTKGAAIAVGTNDAYSFTLKANSKNLLILASSGYVTIGEASNILEFKGSVIKLNYNAEISSINDDVTVTFGSATRVSSLQMGSAGTAKVTVDFNVDGGSGKAAVGGQATFLLRKTSAGSLAASDVQIVNSFSTSDASAQLSLSVTGVTVTAINSTSVAINLNIAKTGSDSTTTGVANTLITSVGNELSVQY